MLYELKSNKIVLSISFILVVILLSPFITSLVVNEKMRYFSIPFRMGDFYFQADEIYNKKEDIDVLFLGSSTLWQGVNPVLIQEELSKKLGRKVTVLVLASNWRGEDLLYQQLKDLLANRKVKLLIMSTPSGSSVAPHPATKYLTNIWDEFRAQEKLPLKILAKVYAESMLATPRLILSLFQSSDNIKYRKDFTRNIINNQGAILDSRGYYSESGTRDDYIDRTEVVPKNVIPEEFIYSQDNKNFKKNSSYKLNHYEEIYNKRIADLAKKHAVHFVYWKVNHVTQDEDSVSTREGLDKIANNIIGITNKKLVSDIDGANVKDFFIDSTHMNASGATYVSRLLVPVIKKLIETPLVDLLPAVGRVNWREKGVGFDEGESINVYSSDQRLNLHYKAWYLLENNYIKLEDIDTYKKWQAIVGHGNLIRYPYHSLGYPTRFSFENGEKVHIKYAGGLLLKGKKLTKYQLFDSVENKLIKEVDIQDQNLPIKREVCYSFYNGGCRYSGDLVLEPLPIGEYYLEFFDDSNNKSIPIYFVVRPTSKENKPDVAVLYHTFTMQAYNIEGGGSLYWINKDLGMVVPKNGFASASIRRPITPYSDIYHTPRSTNYFLKELRDNKIDYFTLSELDLHQHPELLEKVKVLVINVHSEYWTSEMRKYVDDYLRRGGNIANFSGNLAWWKINYIDGNIYIDRNGGFERESKKDYPKVFINTGYWTAEHINYPLQTTFGLTFEKAGYPVALASDPEEQKRKNNLRSRIDEIEILQDHEILKNTGLKVGSFWGAGLNVVYNELDGVALDNNNKMKIDTTYPKHLKILARGYARGIKEISNIGILAEVVPFENSGKIINFGSIGYWRGLKENDKVAKTMFINSVNYLRNASSV